jgi:hypothetical protein
MPTLNKKESERFLKKMLETEKRKPTKKELKLARDIKKSFPNKIRRKVVCVYGVFDNKSDFVLEPVIESCDCDECKKNAFWIEEV